MSEFSTSDVPRMLAMGVAATDRGDYAAGLQILRKVYELVVPEKAPEGLSSFGLCLARVEHKHKMGAEFAERALRLQDYEGKHWANLVRIYIAAKNRRKAVEILEKGLKKTRNDQALLHVRDEIGYRKAPYLRFLSRQNPLNKLYSRHMNRLQKRAFVILLVLAWIVYLSILAGVFLLILE